MEKILQECLYGISLKYPITIVLTLQCHVNCKWPQISKIFYTYAKSGVRWQNIEKCQRGGFDFRSRVLKGAKFHNYTEYKKNNKSSIIFRRINNNNIEKKYLILFWLNLLFFKMVFFVQFYNFFSNIFWNSNHILNNFSLWILCVESI